jgi:hypothetical protein
MLKDKMIALIEKEKSMDAEDPYQEDLEKEKLRLLRNNVQETVDYIREASAEEVALSSEPLCDLIRFTKSQAILDAFEEAGKRMSGDDGAFVLRNVAEATKELKKQK